MNKIYHSNMFGIFKCQKEKCNICKKITIDDNELYTYKNAIKYQKIFGE